MRILWISKASVTASYRAKLHHLQSLRRDWSLGLVTGAGWGPVHFETRPDDGQYAIYQLPQILTGRNHFHIYRGLAKVIRQFAPDILHIDEEHYSMVTAQSILLARRYRVPHIVFQTWQNIYKRYPWPFSDIERLTFRFSQSALAGTQEIRQVLERKGYRKPIAVIPLGTDTRLFHPLDAGERIAARDAFSLGHLYAIGYIGRLVKDKGLPDLFDAIIPWLKTHPAACLVVAGDGNWADTGRRLVAEAQLSSQVRWIPWLASDQVPRLMSALDVLVVPSRTTPRWKEQFGRVLTEAMAVGLPVIGSNSGEIPHVIDTAGLVVPERDPQALRDAIGLLADKPSLRHDYAKRGIERVQHFYTQEVVARQLATFYDSLIV